MGGETLTTNCNSSSSIMHLMLDLNVREETPEERIGANSLPFKLKMTGSESPRGTGAGILYFTRSRLLNMLAVKILIRKHSDEALWDF